MRCLGKDCSRGPGYCPRTKKSWRWPATIAVAARPPGSPGGDRIRDFAERKASCKFRRKRISPLISNAYIIPYFRSWLLPDHVRSKILHWSMYRRDVQADMDGARMYQGGLSPGATMMCPTKPRLSCSQGAGPAGGYWTGLT